jgi:site-specific recombinase XerD
MVWRWSGLGAKQTKPEHFFNNFVLVLSRKMSIVTFSDTLIKGLTVTDGRILRDRVLCGLCLKAGKRTRTFIIATSVAGKQFRMTLGRWPMVSVDEARAIALLILKDCRLGQTPARRSSHQFPTLSEAIVSYCKAKKLKQSSTERYLSIARTHFAEWQDVTVDKLSGRDFAEHCCQFAQKAGAALVEIGRGLIGSLFKYLNATHTLSLESPFVRLAAAGLMPERAKPRARKLLEAELPRWRQAVERLPDKQRDYLLLVSLTGLRRHECLDLTADQVDFQRRIVHIPKTKTDRPHSLPVTPMMEEILRRRCGGIHGSEKLFDGVSADHVAEMAERAGAPEFMLHDLRKMVATVGEQIGLSDAIKRRILNHAAKRGDTLHRHYVSLADADIRGPLIAIQERLQKLMSAGQDDV